MTVERISVTVDVDRLRDTVDVECDLFEKGHRAAMAELYENAPAIWLRHGTVVNRLTDAGIAGSLHRLARRKSA